MTLESSEIDLKVVAKINEYVSFDMENVRNFEENITLNRLHILYIVFICYC